MFIIYKGRRINVNKRVDEYKPVSTDPAIDPGKKQIEFKLDGSPVTITFANMATRDAMLEKLDRAAGNDRPLPIIEKE